MSTSATWSSSDAIHQVRREYFQEPLPASTMVEIVKMTHPDYLIEINAIAVIPDEPPIYAQKLKIAISTDRICVGLANSAKFLYRPTRLMWYVRAC